MEGRAGTNPGRRWPVDPSPGQSAAPQGSKPLAGMLRCPAAVCEQGILQSIQLYPAKRFLSGQKAPRRPSPPC